MSIDAQAHQALSHAISRASRDRSEQTALAETLCAGTGIKLSNDDELRLLQHRSATDAEDTVHYCWDWSLELGTGRAAPSRDLVDLTTVNEILRELCNSQAQEQIQLEKALAAIEQDLDSLTSELYFAEGCLASANCMSESIMQEVSLAEVQTLHQPLQEALDILLHRTDHDLNSNATQSRHLQEAFVHAHEISTTTRLEIAYSRSLIDASHNDQPSDECWTEARTIRESFEALKPELRGILVHVYQQQYGKDADNTFLCHQISRRLHNATKLREASALANKHNFLIAVGHAVSLEKFQMFDYVDSMVELKVKDWESCIDRNSKLEDAMSELISTTPVDTRRLVQPMISTSALRRVDSTLSELYAQCNDSVQQADVSRHNVLMIATEMLDQDQPNQFVRFFSVPWQRTLGALSSSLDLCGEKVSQRTASKERFALIARDYESGM